LTVICLFPKNPAIFMSAIKLGPSQVKSTLMRAFFRAIHFWSPLH